MTDKNEMCSYQAINILIIMESHIALKSCSLHASVSELSQVLRTVLRTVLVKQENCSQSFLDQNWTLKFFRHFAKVLSRQIFISSQIFIVI